MCIITCALTITHASVDALPANDHLRSRAIISLSFREFSVSGLRGLIRARIL